MEKPMGPFEGVQGPSVPPPHLYGKRRFVDPSDSSAYFEIDPANAKITAAGSARRVVSLPLFGSPPKIGGAGEHLTQGHRAWQHIDGADISVVWSGQIPHWFDTTELSTLRVYYYLDATANNKVARMSVNIVGGAAGDLCTNVLWAPAVSEHTTWPILPAWAMGFFDVTVVPASTFPTDAIIGATVTRHGGDAEDTLDTAFFVFDPIYLLGTRKEL